MAPLGRIQHTASGARSGLGQHASSARDPRAFDHPDELDFDRSSPRHLTFGYGVHQCLGQHLSRVELEVAYTTLLRRVPTLATTLPVEQLSFKQGTTVYGVEALEVTW